jgi:8-oxo-dGTP diphosphatase
MRIRPAALIIENNHVLFLRYDYPGGSKFALPGGNVDAGETFPVTTVSYTHLRAHETN